MQWLTNKSLNNFLKITYKYKLGIINTISNLSISSMVSSCAGFSENNVTIELS